MGHKKIDVKATLASRDSLSGGVPFLKLAAGKTTGIRILPPREDHPNDTFFLALPLHYGVGRNEAIVPCPFKLHNAYCPVCEYNAHLAKIGKENERVSTRCLMNVVVIDEDGNPIEEKVSVFTAPQTLVADILDEMAELPEKEQDITDPKRGRDIFIKRKGSSRKQTRYTISLMDPSPFPLPELLDQTYDLTTVFTERSEDAIIGLLTGGSSRDEDPWEELEEGKSRKALPRGRPRVVDDDEEEEPEEGEFRKIDEEEEEDPPAPRTRARRAVEPPEDEEEEEAEEAPPAPRARRTTSRPRKAEKKEEPEEEPEEGDEPGSARSRLAKHLKTLK